MSVTHNDESPPEDNVSVALYDPEALSELHPDWDSLPNEEKLQLLEDAEVEPDEEFSQHNVTTDDYHRHLAKLANRSEPNVQPKEASHIAFGSDDTTSPSTGNSSLNNEVERFTVTDASRQDEEYQSITLLSSDQAVGSNLLEAGLVSDADTNNYLLFNHVLLDDPNGRLNPKTQDYAVTIRINLQYKDASEV